MEHSGDEKDGTRESNRKKTTEEEQTGEPKQRDT